MRITLIATLVLVAGAPALAAEFEQTIAADGVRQVTVAVASAEVFVTGWKETSIKVEADADPVVKVDGKAVTIGAFDVEKPPTRPEEVAEWEGRASEITVRMPAAAALTVRTLAGDVVVKAVAGRVQLHVVSGDVRVEGGSGPTGVEAVSGDVGITGLSADLDVQSVSGEITVRGFAGLVLEGKSVSGAVDVRDAEARTVRLSSHSGDVIYRGEVPDDGSVELTSFSGNAMVALPPGSGFEVEASTGSGSITLGPEAEVSERSERRLHARTTKPGPRLRLKSFSGDVVVK